MALGEGGERSLEAAAVNALNFEAVECRGKVVLAVGRWGWPKQVPDDGEVTAPGGSGVGGRFGGVAGVCAASRN